VSNSAAHRPNHGSRTVALTRVTKAFFVGYDRNGDGAAVMTNGQGGIRLASEVMSAIATEYNWPDWRPTERTEVKVDPAVLAHYVGTYQLAPDFSVTFTLEGDQLMTQATNQPKFPVYPESPTKFFLKVVDAESSSSLMTKDG